MSDLSAGPHWNPLGFLIRRPDPIVVKTVPGMQETIIRKSLNMRLAGSLFLPGSIAVAADCDFSSEDFFPNATAQVVEECILKGPIDINSRTEKGSTPLHWAAYNNPAPAVISALLEAGADPQLVDDEGKSAWDHIQENPELKNTDAYRQLNDLRHQ